MLVATSVLAMLGLTPASAEGTDPLDAVADVAPAVLTDASVVEPDEVTTVGEVEVVVPSDATEGVSLDVPGTADFSIGLPFADDAELVESGDHPFFDNGNGSSTVPLAKDDGSVQILTTIDNAGAPDTFTYDLDVADGSSLTLTATGGAVVTDSDGNFILAVAEPWAVDANGAPVPTHYEVDGTTLTQIVDFDASTAFPVVADPSVSFGWKIYLKYNKAEVKAQVSGWRGTASDKAKYASVFCAALVAGGAIGAVAAATCAAYAYDSMSSLMTTFKSAASAKKSMELQFVGPVLVGWKAYSC